MTHHTPKPLLYARNRPLIDYAIHALVYSGIKTIYVVTHYLECQIVGYLEKYRKNNLDIVFCHQNAASGTAGAVRAAKKYFNSIARMTDELVISATDYVYPEGYIKELMDFHAERSNDISISLRNIDPKMAWIFMAYLSSLNMFTPQMPVKTDASLRLLRPQEIA